MSLGNPSHVKLFLVRHLEATDAAGLSWVHKTMKSWLVLVPWEATESEPGPQGKERLARSRDQERCSGSSLPVH